MSESVVLPWVSKMPLKKQSALLSALRGPDNLFSPHTKRLVKSLRRMTQKDADPSTDYMNLKSIDVKELEREIEFLPLHYVSHLIEALYLISEWAPPDVPPHSYATSRYAAGQWLIWFEQTFHLRYVGGDVRSREI